MKLGAFIVMFVCMIMFLEFVGVPTGSGGMLGTFGVGINQTTGVLDDMDGQSSSFWNWIFASGTGILLLIGVGGAIVVGLFAKSYDTSLIIAPFIVLIGGAVGSTAWNVIKYMNSFGQAWATAIVGIIMAGMFVAFVMSCVDYFAGR